MPKLKVFISSVQSEFANERERIFRYLQSDALLSNFFEPVMFEELPASTQSPCKVYLGEVEQSNIYMGLLGQQYGFITQTGQSPTELEYEHAIRQQLSCLFFIKGDNTLERDEKENRFINRIQTEHTYKRFYNEEQLVAFVYGALIEELKQRGLIQATSFDDTIQTKAHPDDISPEKVENFLSLANYKRAFPVRLGSPVEKVLTHLNLLHDGKLYNSALLAFGRNPQQYFPSAITKCAHYHGLIVEKPIPDHKVFQGDVFQQVDQAVDFVLSKIRVSVGMRDVATQAPIQYEIPRAVVSEAIVNAIAHRNYSSNGSVQVMLFADRLEILNPGKLPPELSVSKLKTDHGSYPANPKLAEPLYQAGYIERFGTGTGEIFRLAKEAGLREPLFDLEEGVKVIIWRPVATTGQVTGQATGQVEPGISEGIKRVILVLEHEMKSADVQDALQLKHREYFRENYLEPAINEGFVEMTIPDKPNSPYQKYRLSEKGITYKNSIVDSFSQQKDSRFFTSATDHATDHVTVYDTDHVDELVAMLILNLSGEKSRTELMELLQLKHVGNFRNNYLNPALEKSYIEMTFPDSPKNKFQKYRLTSKGFDIQNHLKKNS